MTIEELRRNLTVYLGPEPWHQDPEVLEVLIGEAWRNLLEPVGEGVLVPFVRQGWRMRREDPA